MNKSKRETAESLAKAHFAVEPNLKHVYLLEPIDERDADKPIELLEVVEGTIERGIEPIAFTADPAAGSNTHRSLSRSRPRNTTLFKKAPPFVNFGWTIGMELLAN